MDLEYSNTEYIEFFNGLGISNFSMDWNIPILNILNFSMNWEYSNTEFSMNLEYINNNICVYKSHILYEYFLHLRPNFLCRITTKSEIR